MAGQDARRGKTVLYDYYKPTLFPGDYGIEAKQTISVPGQPEIEVFNYNSINPQTPPNTIELQKFTVVASQFSIDPKDVNSVYPPDGQADEGRVLPHIVFNDPHLPWERIPWAAAADPYTEKRQWPPWMALIVFDPNELRVDKAALGPLGVPDHIHQNAHSGAYAMTVNDYMTQIRSRANLEAGYAHDSRKYKEIVTSTTPVNIIFPPLDLIEEIFDDPEKFKYLCHARRMNTDGLPDADNAEALYSICVSLRSGPIVTSTPDKPALPRTQHVHLVSMEGLVDDKGNLLHPEDNSGTERVGIVSLYNWTYLSTPPSPNNFTTIMQNLADTKQPLMPPRPILDAIAASATSGADVDKKAAAQRLYSRLSQGYSITRWRTSTGEETAAFNRGPLAPVSLPVTPSSANDWPGSSNNGKDYQILDKTTGLMDITYSSAWQLGRLLGIADTIFSSALMRFRSTIHQRASSQVRMLENNVVSAGELLRGTSGTVEGIGSLINGTRIPARISLPTADQVSSSLRGAAAGVDLRQAVQREVAFLAGSRLEGGDVSSLSKSPDFDVVRNWITEKLLLVGIPAHYLITDPSHVASAPPTSTPPPIRGDISMPPEALRFFYIDDAWLDCLIDGALSIANHLDPLDDAVRQCIKEVYNAYLRATRPRIPRYGFIVRSSVVKAVPDLRVSVTCRTRNSAGAWVQDKTRLVRLTKMDDNTIFALLDCLPEDVVSIIIAQPAHQQRYVAPIPPLPGASYSPKRLYSAGAPVGDGDDAAWPPILDAELAARGVNVKNWYSTRTRLVDVERMRTDLEAVLRFDTPPSRFTIPVGSGVMALQLSDKNYQLKIGPPPGHAPPFVIERPARQLWTRASASPAPERRRVAVASPQRVRPVIQEPADLDESISLLSLRAETAASQSPAPVVPGTRITIPPKGAPPGILLLGRFLLSIHPTYRAAAPLPYTDTASTPPRKLFSTHDYIPTQSTHLVDLVFSLHRNRIGVQSGVQVTSLTIIVPTTDPTGSPLTGEEPLLMAPYVGAGVSMLHNRRLTPVLTSAPGQLQITLVPRSAAPGQVLALPNMQTADASFVLKGCRIASTAFRAPVDVMGSGTVQAGLAILGLVERYKVVATGVSRQASYRVETVKRDSER